MVWKWNSEALNRWDGHYWRMGPWFESLLSSLGKFNHVHMASHAFQFLIFINRAVIINQHTRLSATRFFVGHNQLSLHQSKT
jgi:hypothetical protein